MPDSTRQTEAIKLLGQLRDDLEAKKSSNEQIRAALDRLKVLGRDAGNVSTLYNEAGVKVLGSYAFGEYPAGVRQEALRCIANALLLLPITRQHSISLGLDKKSTDALGDANLDEEFLLSRILFLLTYDPRIDLQTLLDDHKLADKITKLLNRHVDQSKTTQTANPDSPALQETLKLLFNVTSGGAGLNDRTSFISAIRPLFQLLDQLPSSSPPLKPPTGLVVNALANIDFDETPEQDPAFGSGVDKLLDLLSSVVTTYPPTELETSIVPLLTTLRNINVNASPELRAKLKNRLLPDDNERDQPLGKSSSLASHLLRLTTSTGSTNLSEAISGLMFELSDKDASQYVHNVGYGYAAGYLMTHKIPIPDNAKTVPQQGRSGSNPGDRNGGPSRTVPVNPITGQRIDAEPAVQVPEMSREEAEREAERLFVLFERLKATGVANVTNPVQLAMEQGRLQELSDSDDSD
ncbi:hypothetical protein PV08_09605 [Exophiala spinifera]|uniref:Guanine nucleotide exchange factor synembryn n=1 Tax=Exophiala spinifera TaxID=91928 RepID=A0A0D2B030_9EURO|nr:uncharacterized protein PV08_09605 [Exophiala spinifera]KIW12328.1 hypothetical protein PV08_09605 [Exophiala spinifera]